MFKLLMINKNHGEVCGISEYGQYLCEAMPIEEVHVSKGIARVLPVLSDYNGVIVQWDYSFYPLNEMEQLISECNRLKIPILIVMHTYLRPNGEWNFGHGGNHVSKFYEAINNAIVVVHNEYIKTLVNNDAPYLDIKVIPHGCLPPLDAPPPKNDKLVIGGFGFCVPYKGFNKLLSLAKEYPNYEVRLFAAVKDGWPESVDMGLWVKQHSRDFKNFTHRSNFMPINEAIEELSKCDLIVMGYEDKVDIGASGAIRIAMASGRPVITTKVPFTVDFDGVLYMMDNNSTKSICEAINAYHSGELDTIKQRQYLLKNNWVTISTKMLSLMFKEDMLSLEAIHPHPDRIYKDPVQKARIDWLKNNVKGQFCEVGCATGYVTQYCGGGIGLDIDDVRLEIARQTRSKCTFDNHPVNWLPAEISGIDVLYPDILEHIPLKDAREALGHALEAGNRVLITMPLPESPWAPNPEHIWLPTEDNLYLLYRGLNISKAEVRDEHFYYAILEAKEK